MRILIAEDDPVSRRMLEKTLLRWGYDVVVAVDGAQAWRALEGDDAPHLAVLDWMMPEIDGVEVCRRVRALGGIRSVYIILLTAKGRKEDTIQGLEGGADDYLTKPFDHGELKARVQVGVRVIDLQLALAERVRELEESLANVKLLQGLLPICSYCKKIRDDKSYWHQVESYVTDHSGARFSHGICPDCYGKIVTPEIERMEQE